MDTPVEVGLHERVVGAVAVVHVARAERPVVVRGGARQRAQATARADRRDSLAAVVVHRLGDAPVEEADGDAARVHHAEPLELRELGLGVVAAELEVAVLGEHEVEDDAEPDVLRAHVEPRPLVADPVVPHRPLLARLRRRHERVDDEGPDGHDGEARDEGVKFHVPGLALAELDEGQLDAPPGLQFVRHGGVGAALVLFWLLVSCLGQFFCVASAPFWRQCA
mmetsp:Transcript_14098/g.41539  ORF Transcript_14098/g.41539 Transcript_14098/m.41539 type:complete len:223 (-) Transcript_14098:2-670(-)